MTTENHAEPEYVDSGIPQPYHLVKPSIWPLLGSLAAGIMMAGMVMFMHKEKLQLGSMSIDLTWKWPIIGLIGVLIVMFAWWRKVIREATIEKAHTPIVGIGLRYGMALFICSEVMFFSAFFWAYYAAALYPATGVWPPANIHTFSPLDMPFIMTLILLLSGTTVTWAHHAILENNRRDLIRGLACTVALGLSFSLCQAYEYSEATFSLKSGIFGSTFYMATGFHGLHVIIGTIFLAVCLYRAIKGHFTPENHFGLEAAAWYWHFVDVVWLFLFISVYMYGSSPGAGE